MPLFSLFLNVSIYIIQKLQVFVFSSGSVSETLKGILLSL